MYVVLGRGFCDDGCCFGGVFCGVVGVGRDFDEARGAFSDEEGVGLLVGVVLVVVVVECEFNCCFWAVEEGCVVFVKGPVSDGSGGEGVCF